MARKSQKTSKETKLKKKINIKKIILFAAIAAVAAAVAFVVWVAATTDFSFGDSTNAMSLKLTSVVYWQDPDTDEWEEYEYLSSGGNKIWTDIDTIPNYLEDAFVAIEDQRFLSHHGVDWRRTLSAVFNEVFKGGSTYGGSSITQQLVKNLTGERDRKYMRKIKEIIRALVIETKYSKQQILELYLNSIYLGQGCNGVEAAAQAYFNKSVNELTLAESASIAGITQYPALYDPFENKEKNIEKQHIVLAKMLELGYISQEDYDEALAEELHFERGEANSGGSQSYFADAIVEDLIVDLCEEYDYTETEAVNMIYNAGLKIYATVNKDVQEYAEEIFENDDNFPKTGGEEQPQAAMVITEPETGHVKTIIGGRGEKTLSRGWNRATQTTRQPGSTIKPLSVYAPAIDAGVITPDSVVADEPITIGSWSPKNYYSGFYGDMTIRRAVSISANIPAVKVLQELTIDKSYDYMTNRLNFTTLVDKEERDGTEFTDRTLASLALGGLTDGVTVLEMSAAYGSFPNNGVYLQPVTYTKVEDNLGKTVLVKDQKRVTAFKPTTAYYTNQLLQGVVSGGTAAGAAIPRMETAGKTGTTDNDTDRWFVGYTPHYVCAVWVGFDSHLPLPAFSSNPALSLWKKVMTRAHQNLEGDSFARPSGLTGVSVCAITGNLAGEECYDDEGNSSAVFRYYVRSDAPKVYCDGEHGKTPEEVAAEAESEGEGNGEDGSSEGSEGEDSGSSTGEPSEGNTSNENSTANGSTSSGSGDVSGPEGYPVSEEFKNRNGNLSE